MIKSLKNSYMTLVNFGQGIQPFILLAIRLVWGTLLLWTGLGKISSISQTISFFYKVGIPFHETMAHVVAWTEAVGGALLILGLATRVISLPLMVIMVTAFFLAHSETISLGAEAVLGAPPFTFFMATVVLFSFGPGKLSADYLLERLFGVKIER